MNIFFYLADILCQIDCDDEKIGRYFVKVYNTIQLKKTHPQIILSITFKKGSYSFQARNLSLSVRKKDVSQKELMYVCNIILQYEALPFNILFLHACAFVYQGKACIFSGPSGAGKTTIMKQANKNTVLAEDSTIIKKRNSHFYVYPSPFDRITRFYQAPKPVKIGTIFFIRQMDDFRESTLDIRNRLAYVLGNNYSLDIDKPYINLKRKRRKPFTVYYSKKKQISVYSPLWYELLFELAETVKIKRLGVAGKNTILSYLATR